MPDDGSELAKTIAQAYRAGGIAAKVHGGKLFIEREEGWEGPVEPTSAQTTCADDIRAIESRVRHAASRIIENLSEAERSLIGRSSAWYLSKFLADPERYKSLGHDDRRARYYAAQAMRLHLWVDFHV